MTGASTELQQEAIVSAALALLASGGPQALRVRDIAEAAGYTTMTVYSRFGGKDGVIEAIYVDGYRRFADALRQSRPTNVPAADSLEYAHNMGSVYRDWALSNPGSYQVMFTEAVPGFAPSEDAAGIASEAFSVLIEMVQSLQMQGHFHVGDPMGIALAIWGMAHGLVMLELSGIGQRDGHPGFESVYTNAMVATVRGFAP